MFFTIKKVFLIIGMCVLLTNCATKKSNESTILAPAKKPNVENTVKTKRLWTQDIGSSFNKDSAGFQISADKDSLYVASQSGNVAAFDLNDKGSRLWKTKIKGNLSAGVNFGINNVYVADNNGVVYALNKDKGTQSWKKQLSSEVLVSPVETSNVAIVRSQDGKIVGLDSTTGEQKWALKRDVPSLSLRRDISPLIVGKAALIGLSSGSLLALDATIGRALWDIPISTPAGINELERMRDIAGIPLINRNILFLNSFQGEIISIDASSQQLRWVKKVSSHQQMAEDNRVIFATANDSTIIALNKSDGAIIWQNDQLIRRGVSAPSVIGEYVLVFGNDSDMYLFTKSTGVLAARFSFPGKRAIGNPIILEDDTSGKLSFIALSDNGNAYAYEIVNK